MRGKKRSECKISDSDVMTIVIQNYSLFNSWNGCLRLGADYRNINFFPEAVYLTAQIKNTL